MIFRRIKIREHEKGILFHDKQFVKILDTGVHWVFGWVWNFRVDIFSTIISRIVHPQLEMIVKSGQLAPHADIFDLNDDQVGLIWVDGRISGAIGAGVYAFWNQFHDISIDIFDIGDSEIEHAKLPVIRKSKVLDEFVNMFTVETGTEAILKKDGKFHRVLEPGQHMFWKDAGVFRSIHVEKREVKLEVSGQELITADKVTLRINAMVTSRVVDIRKAIGEVDDFTQALYKEAQLVIRETIGTRDLETILAEKDSVSQEMQTVLTKRAHRLGIEVLSFGIKDIILPGDMKDLMNKVVEAKKTSEANLIVRREETAALRSQMNSAKILESSPVLMKLKELEILEKIAGNTDLKVILGDEGLKDKIMKLI